MFEHAGYSSLILHTVPLQLLAYYIAKGYWLGQATQFGKANQCGIIRKNSGHP
jgi:hypothetical protein